MKSCLYECRVMHERFSPRRHRFLYRIFLFAVDLDELDLLHRRLPFFSVNRPNFFSFRESDYFPHGSPSETISDAPASTASGALKRRVAGFLRARGIEMGNGRVVLVTLPRVAGYLFNPVSIYYCFGPGGAPVAAIAEVTNTFKEMKPYLIRAASAPATENAFHARVPKFFYVSPFSDVDVEFDFTLRVPAERLSVQIDDYIAESRTLTSILQGPRRDLTSARLAWYGLKYPLITLKIIGLIHWHAFWLWVKRVPWFAKAARASDQRDLVRPHSSIAPAAASRAAS